jgi:hypothetical protein
VLVGALLFTGSPVSNAANPQDVRVVNTTSQPVPTAAQGTTTIAGNVGISGTPTVNLASGTSVGINGTPTVNLASGATVGINSAANNPVFVRSVDDAVRDTFQEQVTITLSPNGEFSTGGSAVIPVPAGKRAVIEYISAEGQSTKDRHQRYAVRTIKPLPGGGQDQVLHTLVSERQGDPDAGDLAFYNVSQPLRLYSEEAIILFVGRVNSNDLVFVNMTVSGYYVNVP